MSSRSLFVFFGSLLLLHAVCSEETDKNQTDSFENFNNTDELIKPTEFVNTTAENLPFFLDCIFTIEEDGQLITVVDKTREEIESEGKKIHEENCTAVVLHQKRLSFGTLASLTGS